MTKGLGLLSHQEIKIVIPKWWTWWRWLVRSPTAWKASLESLKVLTLVPNPTGISPQTHVMCGWRRVLMHKHYNMSMHSYFLCLVVCLLVVWVVNWLFVWFCIKCFYTVVLDHSFPSCVSKIQKLIKSRKSKKFDQHCWVLSLSMFCLVPLY